MEINEEELDRERAEDTTKYGEFISTYFAWVSPKEQRKNVERLEKITNKNNKK